VNDDSLDVLATVTAGMATIDAAATWLWLDLGLAIEGNPLVAWLIDLFGHPAGLTLRTAFVALLLMAAVLLAPRTLWAQRGVAVAALGYAGVLGFHAWGALGGAH
jgi:hypothetical protein